MKSARLGLLTCQKFPEMYGSDKQLLSAIRNRGIEAEPVIWDDVNGDFAGWSMLVFRNTWDYFEKQVLFRDFLQRLKQASIPTCNPVEVVEGNLHKFYLRQLSEFFPVIPTVFVPAGSASFLEAFIPVEWTSFVVKPAVSAGSFETRRYHTKDVEAANGQYKDLLTRDDLLIQQFLPEIISEGEVSLVYLGGQFSHAVRKKPQAGDFRVQSQFGGKYEPWEPPAQLLMQATRLIEAVAQDLLFARVDGVMVDNQFLLMELEMIEPDLYLDHHPAAIDVLADLIAQKLQIISNKTTLP